MNRASHVVGCLAVFLAATGATLAAPISIDVVPVGNPGNAGELSGVGAGGFGATATVGAVSTTYYIGTYEVTNAQYTAFLNAKAADDPLGLYNTNMGSDVRGGINRSGASGSFSYTVRPNMGDKPVNFVSWFDSIRFANWLHNGQGAGDTETGAYTVLGGTPTPSNADSIVRNSGALWFLPSENEWYKAAYYDPTLGGGSGGYWDYATKSNVIPASATANSVGDINNPGANVANHNLGADWNSQNGNVTTVGSAGPLSESYYGTSDQSGNMHEWNEALFSATRRGARGGSWSTNAFGALAAFGRHDVLHTLESNSIGFRVASVVPEPSSFALAGFGTFGALLFAALRSRRKGHLPSGGVR